MATQQPVWIRQYLKNLGATDDEIDYSDGVVTYKDKPFYYGTPNAEGRVVGNQSDFDSAYASYQGRETQQQSSQQQQQAQEQARALQQQARAMLQQYAAAPAIQPFQYTANPDQIRNSAEFQASVAGLEQDAQRGTNQALVSLGRRGIGNSRSAESAALAQQQNVTNQVNNVLLPRMLAEDYNRQLSQWERQAQLAQQEMDRRRDLIGLYDTAAQRETDAATRYMSQAAAAAENERLRQAEIAEQRQAEQKAAAEQRLAEEKAATEARQAELKEQQQELDNLWRAAEITGTLPDILADYYGLPRGVTTLEAERVGISRQNAQTSEFSARSSAEIARQNAATSARNAATTQANAQRAAQQQEVNNLFRQWEMTGVAPNGLEAYGVAAGTPLFDPVAARQTGSSAAIDAKTSADNYALLLQDLRTPNLTQDRALQLLEANRDNLTDQDYRRLREEISNTYQ